jgi:hypothetical protein
MTNNIEKASSKLKEFMIKNMFASGTAVESAAFFISVEKEVNSFPFRAAVGFKHGQIVLKLDADFILESTEEIIDFALLHELGHVARLSFMRTDDLVDFYNVVPHKIAPFADPPINESLRYHDAYDILKNSEEGMLTYDALKQQKVMEVIDDNMTYEELVIEYMKSDNSKDLNIPVYFIDSEGNVVDKDGKTVDENSPKGIGVASPDKKDIQSIKESIEVHIDNVMKSIGNRSVYFLDEIQDAAGKDVDSGLRKLERYLVGKRTSNVPTERSFARPKRKALPMGLILPETSQIDNAYNCLYMVDESGSMDNTYISYAAGLLQKILAQNNSDVIYVAQWDTELHEPMDKIDIHSPKYEYTRKGGGGTDFANCFSNEKIKAIIPDIDLVVFITDAYVTSLPVENIYKPILWLVTEEGYAIDQMKSRGDTVINIKIG